MKPLTAEQEKFIEKTRAASDRAAVLADEADTLNLPILAREWSFLGQELRGHVELQVRAFQDDTLAVHETEKVEAEL